MNETRSTTHNSIERRENRRYRSPSKHPIRIGEMTYLLLITVAAAVLTGGVALLFTMPGGTFATLPTGFGAADGGLLTSIRT
jgi:hypothetical protein